MKKLKLPLILSGAIFALGAILLSSIPNMSNPKNMAFCIACFLRDIAGALKLHTAGNVQYFRPEIVGILLGAFLISVLTKEYKSTAGSSPFIRFFLGFAMMIGALIFLGCPLRMVIRMAAGDLNAYVALIGFVLGVATGTFALKKNFTLSRTYETQKINGAVLTITMLVLMLISIFGKNIFASSQKGPGSMHAPVIASLMVGCVIGAVSQKSRTCFAGGIRDAILIKNFELLSIIGSLFIVLLVYNIFTKNIKFSFAGQPIAHSKHLWSILGMYLVGFSATLAGGCPFRQLVLAAQGSSDSAMTVLGMIIGAATAHNFNLASAASSQGNPGGPAMAGKIVLLVCIALAFAIGFTQKRTNKLIEVK